MTARKAVNAGYKMYVRCKPDDTPYSPVCLGNSIIVQRTLKKIELDGYFSLSKDRKGAFS